MSLNTDNLSSHIVGYRLSTSKIVHSNMDCNHIIGMPNPLKVSPAEYQELKARACKHCCQKLYQTGGYRLPHGKLVHKNRSCRYMKGRRGSTLIPGWLMKLLGLSRCTTCYASSK